jgi:hypothetical protein
MLPRMLPNQDGSTSRIRTSRFGQTQGYREGADEDEVYIPAQEPMASITPAIVSHQVFPERIAGPMATGTWNTEKSYPRLRYASLCWAQHLFTSLPADDRNFAAPIEPGIPITSVDTRRHDLETFIPASQPVWLPYLSRFLLSRPSVTNWVQACYAFHLVPPVWKLINPMLALAHRTSKSTAEGREIHWVLHGVVQLRDAVNELEHNYRAALVSNPSLLWQPDITSTTDRNFWPTWTIEEEEHDDRLGPPTLSIRVPRPFAARQILGPI